MLFLLATPDLSLETRPRSHVAGKPARASHDWRWCGCPSVCHSRPRDPVGATAGPATPLGAAVCARICPFRKAVLVPTPGPRSLLGCLLNAQRGRTTEKVV